MSVVHTLYALDCIDLLTAATRVVHSLLARSRNTTTGSGIGHLPTRGGVPTRRDHTLEDRPFPFHAPSRYPDPLFMHNPGQFYAPASLTW